MTNLSNISYDDYLEFEDTLIHFGVKGLAGNNAVKNFERHKQS